MKQELLEQLGVAIDYGDDQELTTAESPLTVGNVTPLPVTSDAHDDLVANVAHTPVATELHEAFECNPSVNSTKKKRNKKRPATSESKSRKK